MFIPVHVVNISEYGIESKNVSIIDFVVSFFKQIRHGVVTILGSIEMYEIVAVLFTN